MKKLILLIIFSTTLFSSCSKDDSNVQSGCVNSFNLLINKDWFPPEEDSGFFAIINFNSNGNYSENGLQDGTWKLDSDCTTMHLIVDNTGGIEYQYQIISITSNLLKIKGPLGIIITYHS